MGVGLTKYLLGLALNLDPPNHSIPSSWHYRCEQPVLTVLVILHGHLYYTLLLLALGLLCSSFCGVLK
jgi:hypothetical protein